MDVSDKVSDHWTKESADRIRHKGNIPQSSRRNWWDSKDVISRYSDLYLKDQGQNQHWPAHRLLWNSYPGRKFKHAISVGSGVSTKEFKLLESGAVEHFTLVEISQFLCEETERRAAVRGLSDKIRTVCIQFDQFQPQHDFDLVYWDAALHHMMEVRPAIAKSIRLLKTGGVFLMDDYVGATYNQHRSELYDLADYLRSMLPSTWFESEDAEPRHLGRYSKEEVLASDPSEAADSSAILPEIARTMRGAKIIPMGGAFYALACRDIFNRFEDGNPEHAAMLGMIFEYEHQLRALAPELSLQAMAIWEKHQPSLFDPMKKPQKWQDLIPIEYKSPFLSGRIVTPNS